MKDLVKTGNVKLPCSIQSDWEMKGQISVISTATNCKKVIKPISLKNKWQDILVSRWLIRSDIVHIRSDRVLIHVVCTLHFLICDKSAYVYMLCCPLLQAGTLVNEEEPFSQLGYQNPDSITSPTCTDCYLGNNRPRVCIIFKKQGNTKKRKNETLTVILHGAIENSAIVLTCDTLIVCIKLIYLYLIMKLVLRCN